MDLQTLIDTVYDDLDAIVKSMSLDEAGDLRLHIEYDSFVLPEGTQRVVLRCLQVKEFNVSVGFFGSIDQSREHPLLANHQGPQSQLFFSSIPTSPEEVFYRAHAVLAAEFHGWRDPATYLNGSPVELRKYLAGGYGLLARGPQAAMEALADAVKPILTVRTGTSHVLQSSVMVLTLDKQFVICESIEVLNGAY